MEDFDPKKKFEKIRNFPKKQSRELSRYMSLPVLWPTLLAAATAAAHRAASINGVFLSTRRQTFGIWIRFEKENNREGKQNSAHFFFFCPILYSKLIIT